MRNIVLKSEAYKIIGLAMEVHKQLGCGFLESVYQEAFERELVINNIPYNREVPLRINYKGEPLKKEFLADFICFNKIIIELKALSTLNGAHEAQVLNYLKATGYKLGLLINFGEPSLNYKRLVSKW